MSGVCGMHSRYFFLASLKAKVGWLFLGLTALRDSISVYIEPSPREREKEKRNDRREKNVQTTPIRTYCKRIRPLSTIITLVGRPGTGSLQSTIAIPSTP